MNLANNIPFLHFKARALTAVVSVVDWLDRYVVERTINALPNSMVYSTTFNFLANVSMDMAGLAARLEFSVHQTLKRVLNLERLTLDIELAKAHKVYLDVVENDCTDDEEMIADMVFDEAVDTYAAGVEVLVNRHRALDNLYGFN